MVWTAASIGAIALAVGFVRPTVLSGGSERPIDLSGRPAAAATPIWGNGTLATVGTTVAGDRSDIYLLASGSTVPAQLTSTPDLDEYAPSWSPDGTLLAFIRSDPPDPERRGRFANAAACLEVCDLVVVDGTSAAAVFSIGIAHPLQIREEGFRDSMVPSSIVWAPDGRSLIVDRGWCGIGGCGGLASVGSVLVDVEHARTVEVPPEISVLGWSPDGRWLAFTDAQGVSGRSLVVVPAGHLDESSFTDPEERAGWIVLAESPSWAMSIDWAADSSEVLLNAGMIFGPGPGESWQPATIDAIAVPEGHRRTVIADGANPMASPDGRRLAYHTGYEVNGDGEILTDIWVADLDGADALRIAENAAADSWSPDGRFLVAHDDRSWFTIAADGTDRSDLAVRAVGGGVPWGPTASWQGVPSAE
ncbi:hypothetical protein [Agromyces sp. SYSU T0242]|uniref:hypothetical protein n=1 Tax=Agromyces litoreus TaxID=3158561 RepID=UPI003393FF05